MQIQVCRTDSKELEGALFPFFIIVSLWYNRDIRIGSLQRGERGC